MDTNKPSSCSPIPSTRPNPSARNSECKDPMRRSFTGNPFSKPSSIVPNSRGGFNPNTPANSPSDFHRRSSNGRESVSSLRDFADKENGKDTNLNAAAKVRSPASASKGAKNFMSPTISAASKFTASPRKKILAERNEPVRSSASFSDTRSQVMEDNDSKPEKSSSKKKTVSFSDVKSLIMEEDDFLKPETGLNQNKIEASHDSTVTDLDDEALKSDFVSDSEVLLDSKKNDVPENATEENGCVNLDPTFEISHRTSCSTSTPMLAPLEADPSMPPYDPKTNYLSPRPQFLHYRPNPRIELIRKKDRDGKRLEESFVAESLSDSEVSGILSDDSQKESEDVSSDETLKEEEEVEAAVEEEETELSVSEPNPFTIHKPEESVQAKGVSKSKFSARSKFTAFLLVLVFAGLSISVIKSPVTDLSVLNDFDYSNLYVPPEITEFAKVNFERLAQRSQLWAANSFSYICKLVSDLREVPKLGPLQYSNLTDLLEEYHREADVEFKHEQNLFTPIWESDVRTEPSEEGDSDIETDDNAEEVLEEDNIPRFEEQVHQEIDEVSEDHYDSKPEEVEPSEAEQTQEIDEVSENHNDSKPEEACLTLPAEEVEPSEAEQTQEERVQSDDHNDIKAQTHQPVVISEATEIQPEAEAREPQAESYMNSYSETESTGAEANESQVESDTNLYAELVSTRAENIHQSSELDVAMDHPQISATADTTMNGSEVKFFTTDVVGISLIVLLTLLATTAFFKYAKKGKPSTPNATTTPVDQPAMTKKLDYSPISVTSEHTYRERLSSRNWQTEVDMDDESCPSEMSSFKSSSYSKKGHKESSEAQSQERKIRKNYRRESLASSDFSMGSLSYGSFTSFEKIPKKHGYDDEVVTPVRRSSRLRNQVTSP